MKRALEKAARFEAAVARGILAVRTADSAIVADVVSGAVKIIYFVWGKSFCGESCPFAAAGVFAVV